MENEVDKNAKIIWDYMLMKHELRHMDVIIGLGTNDTKIAERAAELFLKGFAPIIVFTGNSGVVHGGVSHFDKPEAEVFAEVAISCGVPKECILIENKATNTEENILFTRSLLKQKSIKAQSCILVQKPYMERRTYATFKNFWPEADCCVTSSPLSYEDYKKYKPVIPSKSSFIDVMVGDLQRIKEYPKKGFQIPQVIPDQVWQAYEQLVLLGFTKRLIK